MRLHHRPLRGPTLPLQYKVVIFGLNGGIPNLYLWPHKFCSLQEIQTIQEK